MDTFLPKTFVRVSENFELTNFKLSDGFCQDLIANARGNKGFLRISESLNCPVFDLTVVDWIKLLC